MQPIGSSASGSLTGCGQGVTWSCVLISRFDWGQMCFHAHTVVGRMQFFVGCRTDALSFLLTVDAGYRQKKFWKTDHSGSGEGEAIPARISGGKSWSRVGHLVSRNLVRGVPAAACSGKCLGCAPPCAMPFSGVLGGESSRRTPRQWSWWFSL